MMLDSKLYPVAVVPESALAAGFRAGAKGTHSSRTMMFEDLASLLAIAPADASRQDYVAAIVEQNCLGKQTSASRRLASQRISELYSLNPEVPVFRIFRRLWNLDESGRRLLALQCAIARDPLLAATVPYVIGLKPGAELTRDPMTHALRRLVGERINESILAKVVRNASSSWTQSGHLQGRTFKKRQLVQATPSSIAYGLYLAHAAGFRGAELFTSAWIALQDCTSAAGTRLAIEAKRMGLIDLRIAGEVIELGLDRLDPTIMES